MRIIIVCLILAFAGYGCKKNEVVPNVDHSSKYQPLALGHTWIYQVDSIYFQGNGSQKPDTFHFLQRNKIASSFTNEQGQLSYKINRSVKKIRFQNVESEVYAAGIGLIERKLTDVETQPGKYKDGNEYIQTYQQSNW